MADDVNAADGGTPPPPAASSRAASSRARRERKAVLLRLDPAVYDAVAAWAGQELRSVNAQVEWLLRRALDEAGRLPGHTGTPPHPGRSLTSDEAADTLLSGDP